MIPPNAQLWNAIYPVSSRFLPPDLGIDKIHGLSDFIRDQPEICPESPFLADLADLEYAHYTISRISVPDGVRVGERTVNPALELVPVHWHNLPSLLDDQTIVPERGDECLLVFKKPGTKIVRTITASGHDLLALKIVSEGMGSREAADRGFMTAILGNPMPRGRIEEILALQKPEFYQVSLEGLAAHNDYIRGAGHFERTLDFLDLLRELGIYSMVMLTLTRTN